MKPVYLDFETFWSTTHSLTKMSAIEYVAHPDTEIQALAMKVGDAETDVVFGADEIAALLATVDWSDAMAIGHNMSGFDAMILAWNFGIRPKMWACTAAMARSKYSKTAAKVGGKSMVGVSLKKLAAEFGIGAKLDLEATNTKGKRLRDFTPEELVAMREYNKVDTDLCAALFKRLARGFPKAEMVHIDMTTRMLVEPKFVLDYSKLEVALSMERTKKHQSLLELYKILSTDDEKFDHLINDHDAEEWTRERLASAPKFVALLQSRGVPVPMKPSPTNPEAKIPALAKTDEEFIALQEHDDPVVANAARVRLEIKSTLLETRIASFMKAGDACEGLLPAPLRYCGADTTGRWSGEQYNLQNLPRIDTKKPRASDALRLSLRAPAGSKVIVADLSGIELRVNHFLWQVPSSMALYKQDAEADLYRAFAAARYDIEPEAVDKSQRQLAKVAQLGLGFGAGAATFKKVAKTMGGLEISDDESVAIVGAWRDEYANIVNGWRAFQASLPKIREGVETQIDPWGLCVVEKEAVRLPSGRRIHYPALRRQHDTTGKTEWWYGEGRQSARIYAGKGVENLVQALARDVIADHALAFRKSSGLTPVLMVHDELVYLVPEDSAESLLSELQTIMRSGVSWWPQLVTWSEGSVGNTYGEAK